MNRHTFTNSERKAAACAQLWLFKYGLRLRHAGKARALILGSLWHELMSVWWKHSRSTVEARWQACTLASDKLFTELKDDTPGFDLHNPVRVQAGDIADMQALIEGMLRGYEARYSGDLTLVMVEDELVLGHHTISPAGFPGVSVVMGRVDKILVDDYGQHWIGEHKTSKARLDDWRMKNGYDPQAPTYAWLIKQMMDIDVVGVCYDLAMKATRPNPERFKVVSNGSRLSKQLPANCTASAMRDAIRFNGFREEDQPWYQTKLTELDAKPDPFFRREFVRFTTGAVQRVGLELHAESTRLRGYQRRVDKALEQWTEDNRLRSWQAQVVGVLSQIGHEYPRNAGACVNRWGRQCAFLDLCRHQSTEALSGLEQIPSKHRELVDDTRCTCASHDPKFRDARFTATLLRGDDTVSICIVCGLDRPGRPHQSPQDVAEATRQGQATPAQPSETPETPETS